MSKFTKSAAAALFGASLIAAGLGMPASQVPSMKHRAVLTAVIRPARSFAFSNVIVKNVGSGGWIEFNGLGNPVTSGDTPSSMYQSDCGTYDVGGTWEQACEWHNASGYCMDAGTSDGVVYAERCTNGYRPELWATVNGPNGPNNPGYWFNNVYWTQHSSFITYMTEISTNVPSDISADFGAGSGNYAVWNVSS